MPPSHLQGPFFFQRLLEQESFLSILKSYVDIMCSVVMPAPVNYWMVLNHHQRLASLFDLEKKYGLTRKLNARDNPYFRDALRENRTVLGEYLGFYDFFTPISGREGPMGLLLSGLFATEELTHSHLTKSWMKISHQSASSENPGFMEFVRVALDTPVLEKNVLLAFQEALELFAGALSDPDKESEAYRGLKDLTLKVFSKNLPHTFWLDWALGLPSRYVMPLWSKDVQDMDWVRDEIGITRVPTTVITAIPVRIAAKKFDPVEEALRVYRFQRRSFRFARTLPQTVGGRLENYGAVFVTSADPGKKRLQRRRQIEETARRVQRFAAAELGGPVLVGIGETVAPGESLNKSYREAVLALHVGRQSGKELVFFNPGREPGTEGLSELRRLLADLTRQIATASLSDMEATRNDFLKQVLTLSFQSPEEIRWHLQYALMQLMDAARRRSDLGEKESTGLYQSLALGLERSVTTQEMVLTFQEALSKLSGQTGRLERLQAAHSIEKVRDYIDRHFQEPLRISRLAKIAGVSASTFSRRFKKLTGVGLENYLQDRRLEEARRLLKTGNLPVSKISRDCGFKSNPYFIQLFGRKNGLSPQKYRRKFQRA